MVIKIFSNLIREKYDSLSEGQKKVTKYILDNFKECAYKTIAEISTKSGVSQTTVIRTAYTFGFNSFSEMQNAIRKEIQNISTYEEEKVFSEKSELTEFYKDIIKKEIDILYRTMKNISNINIEELAEHTAKAEKMFCVGAKSSYGACVWFGRTLSNFRKNIFTINAEDESEFQNLLLVDKNSIVFCATLERYSKATYKFVKMAKKKGAFIVAVTDSEFSPIGKIADINLITYSNKDETGFNTISGVTAVFNIIAVGVRKYLGPAAINRLKELEKLSIELDGIFE